MRVTIKDIAAAAGVSVATASLAINDKRGVNPATRARVKAIAQELGYRPNTLARGLVMQHTHVIGILISDITNPHFANIIRGIEDTITPHGYHAIICESHDDNPEIELYALQWLEASRVDGIIVASVSGDPKTHQLLKHLQSNGLPIVLVGRHYIRGEFDTVLVANEESTCTAVAHLIEHGHRRIGIICGPPDVPAAQERLAGYKLALAQNNLPFDERLVRIGHWQVEDGLTCAYSLLREQNPPTAIFAANNMMALGAYKAIRSEKLHIPNHLALAAFDDAVWATAFDPPLTVVAQPSYELGQVGAQQLLSRLPGGKRVDTTEYMCEVLLPQFVVRNSCGCRV